MKTKHRLLTLLFALTVLYPFHTQAQPDNTEPLAVQYYQNGEFDKAVDLFGQAYQRNPDTRLYEYYFDCLLQLGRYKEAEKFVTRQQKRYPDRIQFEVDLGYVYAKAGDANAARKQYDATLKNMYGDRAGVLDLSGAFQRRGLTEYAIKALVNGKKLVRNERPLNYELAALYQKNGDFPAALQEYLELLDISGEYLGDVEGELQEVLLDDADNSRNEAFRNELFARIKKNPDKTRYAELLLWYFIQQKEFDAAFIQARSLDKRLSENGERVFALGRLAIANQSWDAGFQCFQYIIDRGDANPYWMSARIDLMDARYQKITSSFKPTAEEIATLKTEYLAALDEMGRNAQTLPLMRNLAHLEAFYLANTKSATDILNQALGLTNAKPGDLARCKIELADILLMSGEIWEATLLYQQVDKAFKNDPLGAEAKFKNAKLDFYIGEFDWARAQLNVLKAATSKLIANDAMQLALTIGDNTDADSSNTALLIYARADLLLFRRMEDLALQTLDSIEMLSMYHPLFDEVLYKKAEVYLQKKDYTMADSLLRKLYDFYSTDILGDDALFKRAQLQEEVFLNTEKAMELYKELLDNYPGSLYVVDARKRYRTLRGDKPTP